MKNKHEFKNIIFNKNKVIFETEKAILLMLDEMHNFWMPRKFALKLPSGDYSVGIVEKWDYTINKRKNKIDNSVEQITIKGSWFFN